MHVLLHLKFLNNPLTIPKYTTQIQNVNRIYYLITEYKMELKNRLIYLKCVFKSIYIYTYIHTYTTIKILFGKFCHDETTNFVNNF